MKQNIIFKKNYDPTVGLNREPNMQQARAFPLRQQATGESGLKRPCKLQQVIVYARACAMRCYDRDLSV